MAIRAKLVGLARLQRTLRKVSTANRTGVQRAIAISGAQVQGDAQRSIQRGGRSGVIVTIAGKRHQRSAAGEPPKTDTGRLAGSIFAQFSPGGLRVDVGTDVVYGPHLEFGTKNMGARPWLLPAFERSKADIKARVRKAVKAAGRKAGRKP
jgi:HK97 gp10 family phage protein